MTAEEAAVGDRSDRGGAAESVASDDEAGTPEPGEPRDDVAAIREAVREVQREWLKAAAIEASLAGAVALAAVNLVLSAVAVPGLPEAVAVPGVGGIPTAAVAGLGAGVAVFAVTLAVRLRRPAVEAFERANPIVAEALRTARDASRHDERTPMAAELYDDVLAGLRGTSSFALLDRRRLVAGTVLLLVLAVAAIQVAATGFALDLPEQLGDGPTAGGPGGEVAVPAAGGGGMAPDDSPESVYAGLQPPEDVLGEPENVTAGTEDLTAVLGEGGGGGEEPDEEAFEEGGLDAGAADVEAQRAGFVSEEPPEDADVIREYNRRIRENATAEPTIWSGGP